MYLNRKGVQFSKNDVYGIEPLSKIIVAWLEKYKSTYEKHPLSGAPVTIMCELFPDEKCHADSEIEEGKKHFINEIDEMIWAFSSDDMPEDCWKEENGEKLSYKSTKDFLNGELDYDKINAHTERRDKGLTLFAKRFDNLWV